MGDIQAWVLHPFCITTSMSFAPDLVAAVRSHDRDEARLVAAIDEFDASGEPDLLGFTSTHAWLKDQGLHPRDAFELVRIARKLRRMPGTAAAWSDGALTGGQVRIITALVIDRHVDLYAEHEPELLPHLVGLSIDETQTALRLWRDRADALNPGPEPRDEACVVHLNQTMDDRGVLNASLDAEGYVLWSEALRLADSDNFTVPTPIRRGEAMKLIAQFFIKNQNLKTPRRHTPHLKVIIDGTTIGTDHLHGFDEATGMTLRPETIERLMCDCTMHRVVMADGVVLDYGRAIKDPPPDLAHAVAARDQGCRWKSCKRPVGWCDIHHVRQWIKHFGPTAISNLVLLCDKHHNVLHRNGWTARLHANGDFEVTNPWGQTWTTHPPGRLRQQLPPPPGGAGTQDDDSPWDNHRDEFHNLVGARRRIEQLVHDAQYARAIASLVVLPRAA